jgi:hypothetical protein
MCVVPVTRCCRSRCLARESDLFSCLTTARFTNWIHTIGTTEHVVAPLDYASALLCVVQAPSQCRRTSRSVTLCQPSSDDVRHSYQLHAFCQLECDQQRLPMRGAATPCSCRTTATTLALFLRREQARPELVVPSTFQDAFRVRRRASKASDDAGGGGGHPAARSGPREWHQQHRANTATSVVHQ